MARPTREIPDQPSGPTLDEREHGAARPLRGDLSVGNLETMADTRRNLGGSGGRLPIVFGALAVVVGIGLWIAQQVLAPAAPAKPAELVEPPKETAPVGARPTPASPVAAPAAAPAPAPVAAPASPPVPSAEPDEKPIVRSLEGAPPAPRAEPAPRVEKPKPTVRAKPKSKAKPRPAATRALPRLPAPPPTD